MADRYLILSDLHLCDIEEHRDGWKFFKSSRYLVDQPVADLVSRFESGSADGDRNTLIFNGDVFDFDLVTSVPVHPPWKVSWLERRCGLFSSPEKSVWKLQAILEDHPLFLDTLASFISGGGKVVYILGNHDREMHFGKTQEVLHQAIMDRLERSGVTWDGRDLEFEPWFFHVPGVLFAEHGNQYDPFASFRDVLSPAITIDGEERLALPMGNLSNRYLLSRIGRFNPFSGDYIRTGASYVGHWLRYYALSKRSLIFNWLSGAVLVLLTLLSTRRREARSPESKKRHLADLSKRTELDVDKLQELLCLHCSPVNTGTFRIVRELWLDRVMLYCLVAATTVAVAVTSTPLWLKLAVPLVCFPVVYTLYEILVRRGGNVFDVRSLIPDRAKAIAKLLNVKLVTFGHDHEPKMTSLDNGGSFADSGTWAPITGENDRTLVQGYRNYLVVLASEGETQVLFELWPVSNEREPTDVVPGLDIRRPAKSCA